MQRDVSSELWDAYKRGDITWQQVQERERARQLQCACGAPTNAIIASGPICPQCLEKLYGLVSDAHQRVSRGAL